MSIPLPVAQTGRRERVSNNEDKTGVGSILVGNRNSKFCILEHFITRLIIFLAKIISFLKSLARGSKKCYI